MLSKYGGVAITLFITIILIIALAPNFIEQTEETRVTQVLNESVSCTTGTSVPGTCTVNLINPHEYTGTRGLSVEQVSPSVLNLTSSSTMATNRQTLTIEGLTLANTQYDFEIDYFKKNPDISDSLNGILRFLPFMLVIALVFGVGYQFVATFRR